MDAYLKEQRMRRSWRHALLAAIILTSFIAMMAIEPFGQDLDYHNFADRRSFWGIPNFFNVMSNILFLIVGLIGLMFSLENKQKEATWSWMLFFFGVTFVAFGSAYYHWNPNNQTLVWDRLPMTVGFMGLFIGILTEYVSAKIEKYYLLMAIVLGFSSVIFWHYAGDLRFYYWIQLIPLLTVPVVLLLFKGRYTHHSYLIFVLICYVFAKIAEFADVRIFSVTQEQFSGHSIKHLLSTLGSYLIYLMLKNRKLSAN